MRVDGLRQAINGVTAYRNTFEREALGAFQEGSRQVTNWEKQPGNHKWIDRSKQAMDKIKCKAYREGNILYMDNGHYAISPRDGFPYGISLEGKANNRVHKTKYKILQTALRRWWGWTIQRFRDRMASVA